jgi:hypothetical protein
MAHAHTCEDRRFTASPPLKTSITYSLQFHIVLPASALVAVTFTDYKTMQASIVARNVARNVAREELPPTRGNRHVTDCFCSNRQNGKLASSGEGLGGKEGEGEEGLGLLGPRPREHQGQLQQAKENRQDGGGDDASGHRASGGAGADGRDGGIPGGAATGHDGEHNGHDGCRAHGESEAHALPRA